MTPNDIEVLIHCSCSAVKHPRYDAPAVKDSLKMFIDLGMIEATSEPSVFNVTEKGRAHLIQLCNTPFPTCKWVDVNGNVISSEREE